MTTSLAGKRVLVAEDDYFIAKSLAGDLREAGADVLGPVASVAEALALVATEAFDAAVLDVNLRGEMAYPLVDAVMGRGIPVVFATGYSGDALPMRYAAVPRCDKPIKADRLVAALFPS